MSNQISPKYQMNIIQNINDKLYELFKSYDDVESANGKYFTMTLAMQIFISNIKTMNIKKLI